MMPRFTTRLAVGAATIAVAVSGSLVGHTKIASADTNVIQCAQTETWFFTPALTTAFNSGTYSFDYSQTCARVDVTTLGSGINSGSATFGPLSYSGSCLTATLGGGGILIGGTVAVFASNPTGGGHFHVLVPANPCLDSGPTPGVSDTTFI